MTAIEAITKALAAQSKDDERAAEKEAQRLKRPPFKTLIEPFSPKTLDELRGWSPPGGVTGDDAYILLEKKMIEKGDRAPDTIVYSLHVMLVGSRPEQFEKLRYNVKVKGMKIIHWDRFPKMNDSNPRRQKLAAAHFNPQDGKCAYDKLEEYVKSFAYNTEGDLAERAAAAEARALSAEARASSLEEKLREKRANSKDKEKEQ